MSDQAKIQFRDIFSDKIIEYDVNEEKLEVVDIPTGYARYYQHRQSGSRDSDVGQ